MNDAIIRKTLADQLFTIIARNGWSIYVAADFMQISRNELSGILNQKKDVQLSTLSRIAAGVDRPIAALICPEAVQSRKNELLLQQIQADLNELKKAGVA